MKKKTNFLAGIDKVEFEKVSPKIKKQIKRNKWLRIIGVVLVYVIYFSNIKNNRSSWAYQGQGLVFAFSIMAAVLFMIYHFSYEGKSEKKVAFNGLIIVIILILMSMTGLLPYLLSLI